MVPARPLLCLALLLLATQPSCTDGGSPTAPDATPDLPSDDDAEEAGARDAPVADAPEADADPGRDGSGDAAMPDGSGADAADVEPDTAPGPTPSTGPADLTGLALAPLGPAGPCGEPVEVGLDIVRAPYLQSVLPDSARVAVTSTRLDVATVRYSVLGSGDWFEVEANTRTFPTSETRDLFEYHAYDARIGGFAPGDTVCYEVWLGGVPIFAGGHFETAFTSHERPVSIFAIGDSGTGSAGQLAVRDRLAEIDADVFLHLGDIAYGDGTFFQFERYVFDVYAPILARLAMWPTPGNHEYNTLNARPYIDIFYLPEMAMRAEDQEYYYSFDYGNVHFVSIDSNEYRLLTTVGDDGADMLDWLEADLAASTAEWKIAFMHHPPYSSSERAPNTGVRGLLVPIFERYDVDLVLAGHDHHYERTHTLLGGEPVDDSDAPTYVVSGAGGAGLRDVFGDTFTAATYNERHSLLHLVIDGCTATGQAINDQGEVVDEFELDGCDE